MRRLQATLVWPILVACHASVQGNANVSSQSGADADLEAQLQAVRAEQPAASTAPESGRMALAATGKPLLGARRDLTLAPGQGTTQCSCLRVALGGADLDAFRWKGAPPAVDPSTQLVVGLTSEGGGCTNPEGSAGASYWGYKRSGDNILVYVENAVKQRPIVAGGIIPKPFGSGEVYVAPIKGSPYGKGADGKPCKVGNPGAPRTTPPGSNENGEDPGAVTGDG